jgi:hypothetical protein
MTELPDELRLPALRSLIENNSLDELAAIELAANLFFVEGFNLDEAVAQFARNGYAQPKTITLEKFKQLPPKISKCLHRNLNVARKELLEKIPGGLFLPRDSDFLVDWIASGCRFSSGVRLPADNYEVNPDNHQLRLSDRSAHFLRHISACFGVALARLPSLWQCFAVLILGRPLEQDEFSSSETIRLRCQRLHIFDEHNFAVDFEIYLSGEDMYGFVRLWFSLSDDSRFFKVDRHGLFMTAHRDNPSGPGAYIDPCFHILTASAAASKDSEGNSDLNVATFCACLSTRVLVNYGGGTTDNAPDAIEESRKTFLKVMDTLPLEKRSLYCVLRRPNASGDPIHCDNLSMTHASIAAFGETDRNDHSEMHHRQLMQSIHDIHNNDTKKSQRARFSLELNSR